MVTGYKKDPYNFHRTTSYIRRIISEEYRSVMLTYNRDHDPFFGWVVGNLVEDKIRTFVIDNYDRLTKEQVLDSKDKYNHLAVSFLMQALRELTSGSTTGRKRMNQTNPGSAEVFPANPKDFAIQDWKMLKDRYEKVKEKEKYVLTDFGNTGTIDTGFEESELGKEKFKKEKGRISKAKEKLRNESERLDPNSQTDRLKKSGGDFNDNILYDVEEGQATIQLNLRGKEIIDLEKYDDLIFSDLTDQDILSRAGTELSVKRKRGTSFGFRLTFLGPNNETFTEEILKKHIQPDLEGYLSGRYLDVTSGIQCHLIDDINYHCLIAEFSLDVVKVAIDEELYFVRNDERYVIC